MLRDLDDPVPLPELSHEQRAAVIARGEHLRRRHRVRLVGAPVALAALTAAVVVILTVVVPGRAAEDVLPPASSPPPTLVLQGPDQTGRAANSVCEDAAGDSAGPPDVRFFSLDRPSYPLFHYALVSGEMPSTGVVEFRVEATSADGTRSRQLVQRIVDGSVVEQYLRDPSTGARLDVPRNENPFGDEGDHGVGGASFPGGAVSGLGDGWWWRASIRVDGVVVDACEPTRR